jgi:hypothetical protein
LIVAAVLVPSLLLLAVIVPVAPVKLPVPRLPCRASPGRCLMHHAVQKAALGVERDSDRGGAGLRVEGEPEIYLSSLMLE